MKRAGISLLLLFVMLLTGCGNESVFSGDQPVKQDFFAMNTYISVTTYGEQAEQALQAVQERTETLEHLWSVTDTESEIYQINHSAGKSVTVSDETTELISFTLEMAEKTGGALDPTIYPVLTAWGFTTDIHRVPSSEELASLLKLVDYKKINLERDTITLPAEMMIDLGAVGKGYASDEAVQLMRDMNITSALLDFGGNIMLIGSKPDGNDWRIGIKNPLGEGSLGVLSISDCAVVTSGNYENYFIGENGNTYGHIIDPSTGLPVNNDLAAVTIIAKDGKLCDALSTALFVMGAEQAADYWRANGGFEMLLVTNHNEILLTEGIAERFCLNTDRTETVKVIIQ